MLFLFARGCWGSDDHRQLDVCLGLRILGLKPDHLAILFQRRSVGRMPLNSDLLEAGFRFSEWFDLAWAYMDTLAESSLAGPSSLTIAELRILRFLPSHRSFREIAAQLGVSANTVKTQAHAVYRKLGAASRSEAVAHAMEAGLLGQ